MQLEIITPDKKLFEGEAKALTVPGSEGSLGILNRHAAMVASLKKGKVKVRSALARDGVHVVVVHGIIVARDL